MNIYKYLLVSSFFLLTNFSFATPIDYNNDSISDPSTVVADNRLRWHSIINSQNQTVLDSFGQVGHHLVPGRYSTRRTQPATIDSSGVWRIANNSSITFGDNGSLFIGGADFNGDQRTDLAYSSNTCSARNAKFHVLVNPLGDSPTYHELPGAKGHFYKTYYDSNNDQRDEICTLVPVRMNKQLTKQFRIRCHDVLTNSVSKKFKVGVVNNNPERVKVSGQPDLLLIYNQNTRVTRLKLLDNTGKVVRRVTLNETGTIIVGNFTSNLSEQIAIVKDGLGAVYDVLNQTVTQINFPEGIPYDQINIVNFQDNENCFCNSKRINRLKSCKLNSNSPVQEEPTASFFIPNNCSNPPKNITANDGFKCMASNTRGGTIVCLLPYQFTWAPYRDFTDHHGVTMKCNRNNEHFDSVDVILKSGQRIPLNWDKCQNYVSTVDGPIGRQHFRNESFKWNDVSNQAVRIEMEKDGQKTCLSF